LVSRRCCSCGAVSAASCSGLSPNRSSVRLIIVFVAATVRLTCRGRRIYSRTGRGCEDHGYFTPAHQQHCQRGLRAFALGGVHLLVLEQRRRQAAEFGVVLRSLRLDVCCVAPCSVSPERSSRSALSRRMSAAKRPGSGVETTSAKVVRNSPASVSGNSLGSSGTSIRRRKPWPPLNVLIVVEQALASRV
jgi:hypothetical protein